MKCNSTHVTKMSFSGAVEAVLFTQSWHSGPSCGVVVVVGGGGEVVLPPCVRTRLYVCVSGR